MAESRRSNVRVEVALDDEKQIRRDRIMLVVFFIGGILILGGMWWLATFLSGQ